MAVLLRDGCRNVEARLEYERYLELTNEPEIIEDDEEIPIRDSELEIDAKMITISNIYTGRFQLTKTNLCFDSNAKTIQLKLHNLDWVLRRSYLHIDKGLEFFMKDGRSYFFYFENGRSSIVHFLVHLKLPQFPLIQQTNSSKFFAEQKFTEQWLTRQISTYEYLVIINFFAGRSFNDLSQYPIFPWILSDYSCENLDLTDVNIYRDLSKPLGALNAARLAKLKREYSELQDSGNSCLYRCHYSTSYYVLHYLIRLEPFTTLHTQIQDGKFDHPERLFSSISKLYAVVTGSSHDFRELIPEFFTLPDFLLNKDNFNLGLENSNVELPNWASSAVDFIQKHRKALESEFISQNINHWIDLVFGYKQNGNAAIEANNVFHPFSYATCMNKKVFNDPELLSVIQHHASNFGIIPRQLFTIPHPPRPIIPPTAKNLKWEVICISNHEILCLNCLQIFVFLTADSILHERKIRQKIQNDWRFPSHSGSITVMKNKIIFISISRDCFHVMETDSDLVHVFSFRQQFSSVTGLVASDNVLVVFSQDGSVAVWDLENQSQIYRINHHLVAVVDVAVNDSLRLIASCDVSNRVVMSELWNGAFIRSFKLLNVIPNRIGLLDEGF